MKIEVSEVIGAKKNTTKPNINWELVFMEITKSYPVASGLNNQIKDEIIS